MPNVSTSLAADRLGTGSVASFALTAAAPIMVVGGYVTTAWAVTGTVAVSFAMAALAVLLAVWCVGYVTMARYITNAGSLYTFLAHGFGPRTAVAGAFVQLVAYSGLQVGLYGIAGVQASTVAADLLNLHAPWWAWALVAWMVVALLGTRGIGVSSRVLAVAVVAELVVVAVVSVVDLTHPAGGQVSLAALNPGRLDSGTLGVALAIAVTAYVGIEQAPVYSEEVARPRSTILVATYLALALMSIVYVAGSWAMTIIVGPDQVVATARQQGPDMLTLPASAFFGGHTLVNLTHILILTSIMAGLLAYHNAVARAAFALGRERVLPAAFGRTSPRTGAPITASLAQTTTGLIVILVYAIAGWDPMARLFFALGTTGALGVLILLTAVSAAIVGFFARHRRGETRWSTLVAPAIATVALGICLYLVLSNYAALLGVDPASPARWALPASYLAAAVLGAGYATYLRLRRPHVARLVGHGANAAITATAMPSRAPLAEVAAR